MPQAKRRRTESDRQYERYQRILGRIRDIYRRARSARQKYAQILAACQDLYGSADYTRLQSGYQSQITAINSVLLAELFERDLEWRLGTVDGPITPVGCRPGNADRWTEELSMLARTAGALYGDHCWIGTDQCFGEWSCVNPAKIATAEV